jgi:hypothetical protein
MLASICQPLVLPKKMNHWSVTSLQQQLVKMGGRLVTYARLTDAGYVCDR